MEIPDDLDPSTVGFEFIKEGSDWLAIFNPKVPRQMDVKLTNRFTHDKCAPSRSQHVVSRLVDISQYNFKGSV
jgi:hypothetical protein